MPSSSYTRRAEEAERLAAEAVDDAERAVHQEAARLWRDLARRRAAKDKNP
jgi:hypothetical protein